MVFCIFIVRWNLILNELFTHRLRCLFKIHNHQVSDWCEISWNYLWSCDRHCFQRPSKFWKLLSIALRSFLFLHLCLTTHLLTAVSQMSNVCAHVSVLILVLRTSKIRNQGTKYVVTYMRSAMPVGDKIVFINIV